MKYQFGTTRRFKMGSITDSKLGRVALGVSTGGLSEVVRNKNLKNIAGVDRYNPSASQFDPQYQRAVAALEGRVRGDAPSLAEEQLRQGLDTNLGDTVSAIRSSAGVSPALRARMIARAGEEQGTEFARAQAVLRAGEQAEAEKTLLGSLGQARGVDVSLEGVRAGSAADASKRRGALFKDVVGGLGQAALGKGAIPK
jgi:hypothetical protein